MKTLMKKSLMCLALSCVAMASLACKPSEPALKLSSKNDLQKARVAVQRATVGHSLAEEMLGDQAQKQVFAFEKYSEAVLALRQQKVDAIVMDEKPAKRFLEKDDKLMLLPEVLKEEAYAIGMRKEEVQLKQEVDTFLTHFQAEGKLEALFQKYAGDLSQLKAADIDLNPEGKSGDLVVGTEAGFAPYELQVSDGFIGIDIELCAALAKKLDKRLVIKNMGFDALPAALKAGQIDLICAGLSITPERQENMAFSIPYYQEAKQVAMILKSQFGG